MMRVFLAGEGRTELGEWAKEPPYREPPGEKGVLVALIERVVSDAVTIVDGLAWSKIRNTKPAIMRLLRSAMSLGSL